MVRRIILYITILFSVSALLPPRSLGATLIVPCKDTTLPVPDPVLVKDAALAFRALPLKEKRGRFSEAKKYWKRWKAERKAGKASSPGMLLLILVAIILPPLAIYLYEGEIRKCFWISLALTLLGLWVSIRFSLLGWLPAVIYTLIILTDEGARRKD